MNQPAMNPVPSAEEKRQNDTSWLRSNLKDSDSMAGNNVPGVAAHGVENVSGPASDAQNFDEDFALYQRITFLLPSAAKETKRHILYLLEPAPQVALEDNVGESSKCAFVDQESHHLDFEHDPYVPTSSPGGQIDFAFYSHQSLAHSAQTQNDPMHWVGHGHDLSQVHTAPEGRRHTYSSNDTSRREAIRVRVQANSAPEPLHVSLPRTEHNVEFPHPKHSKGMPTLVPRNSTQSTHNFGLASTFSRTANDNMVHRDPLNARATHTQSNLHWAEALASSRIRCDRCSETFKGKAELKRHQDSKHRGKNYTCMFPGCPKYDQKFRPDKIKPHLRECHNISAPKVPKSWYWPWQWYNNGHVQGWVCTLCNHLLGTWDLDRHRICKHIETCEYGDSARESRWKGSGPGDYDDDEDISRAFRLSLTLEDLQGSASMSGAIEEEDSYMALSDCEDPLFG